MKTIYGQEVNILHLVGRESLGSYDFYAPFYHRLPQETNSIATEQKKHIYKRASTPFEI